MRLLPTGGTALVHTLVPSESEPGRPVRPWLRRLVAAGPRPRRPGLANLGWLGFRILGPGTSVGPRGGPHGEGGPSGGLLVGFGEFGRGIKRSLSLELVRSLAHHYHVENDRRSSVMGPKRYSNSRTVRRESSWQKGPRQRPSRISHGCRPCVHHPTDYISASQGTPTIKIRAGQKTAAAREAH